MINPPMHSLFGTCPKSNLEVNDERDKFEDEKKEKGSWRSVTLLRAAQVCLQVVCQVQLPGSVASVPRYMPALMCLDNAETTGSSILTRPAPSSKQTH